jgi:hypothetical protein
MLDGRLKVGRLLSTLHCDLPPFPFYSILMLPLSLTFSAFWLLPRYIFLSLLLLYSPVLSPSSSSYPPAPPPLLPLLQLLLVPIPYSIFLFSQLLLLIANNI